MTAGRRRAGPPVAAVSEKDWQKTLVVLLETLGWHVNHVFPLQTKHGWRTGTTAVGWPDLTALRREWIVAIEVKSEKGKADPEQLVWLQRFALIPNARAWLLRPSDDVRVLAGWLRDPASAPRTHGWRPTTQEE